MAAGETNGVGYFQQPRGHSLWAPLALGGVVNFYIMYLHGFRAMPMLLNRGRRFNFIPTLVTITALYLALHLAYQLIIAATVEPSLGAISASAWTIENLRGLPGVLIVSTIYKLGRDWIVHMSDHVELARKTERLEHEFRLVKEELSALRSAAQPSPMLRFESGREKFQVPIGAISHLNAAGNYVEIYCSDRMHTVYGTLAEFEARLAADGFERIHRSHIVNLKKILRISGRKAHLDDAALPIGATYRKRLQERWDQFR